MKYRFLYQFSVIAIFICLISCGVHKDGAVTNEQNGESVNNENKGATSPHTNKVNGKELKPSKAAVGKKGVKNPNSGSTQLNEKL